MNRPIRKAINLKSWLDARFPPGETAEIGTLAERVNNALTECGLPGEQVDVLTIRYWKRPNVRILPPPIRDDGGYGANHFALALLARLRSVRKYATLAETASLIRGPTNLWRRELREMLEESMATGGSRRMTHSEATASYRTIEVEDGVSVMISESHPSLSNAPARRAMTQAFGRALRRAAVAPRS